MSTLKADTIQNTSGGAATLTDQAAAKGYLNYDGTASTPTARDSLNHSSITDNASADHTVSHTNAFNVAAEYLAIGAGGFTSSGVAGGHIGFDRISSSGNESAPTTTARRVSHQRDNSVSEQKYASMIFIGDLA